MVRHINIAFFIFLSQICTGQVMLMFSSDSLASITSPLDVDSLFYWFAADVAVLDSAGGTISNGEGVGTWTDLSGNGYNVAQADTTKDPRWCASCGPASYPAIVFNGVDEFLESAAHWWGSDDVTVIVVGKFANATRAVNEVFLARATGTDKRQWRFYGNLSAPYDMIWITYQSGTLIPDRLALGGVKSTAWRMMIATHNGAASGSAIYIDGVSQSIAYSGISDGTIYDATGGLVIGAGPLQGSISEIIVFSRALTATERTAIENYLNIKYDLYYLIIFGFPLASARRRKLIPNEKKNAA